MTFEVTETIKYKIEAKDQADAIRIVHETTRADWLDLKTVDVEITPLPEPPEE